MDIPMNEINDRGIKHTILVKGFPLARIKHCSSQSVSVTLQKCELKMNQR